MNGKIKIRQVHKATELKRFRELEGEYHHMGETHSGGDTIAAVGHERNVPRLVEILHAMDTP